MKLHWIVFLLSTLIVHINGVADGLGFDFRTSESPATFKYDRIEEVKRQCGYVLKSASNLKPEDSRIYSIKKDLYFLNGDWEQELGDSPILPFDNKDVPSNYSKDPVQLVSFWIVDVDRDQSHRTKKSLSVSGLLSMGITFDSTFSEKPYEGGRQFEIWPGHTGLSVPFQGIYTESRDNGGERVLCLLGNTMLPSRESDSKKPWKWVDDSHFAYNQPPLSEDDQILLVLRFPVMFNLTNRIIRGKIKSLNPRSNSKFFDEVRITSQLGKAARYEFDSEKKLISKSCDPYPYHDSFLESGINIYKGLEFCRILEEAAQGQAFTIVPNWKCNGTDDFCSKLGPFVIGDSIRATDGGFKDVFLFMQEINCQKVGDNSNSSTVAAVFRAVGPSENHYTASARSGPNNMTMSAEGILESSSGQLCMIGCLGMETEGCNFRICLYIPTSFSIRQRSILVGSISSIDKDGKSFFPLSFEKLVRPTELYNYFKTSSPSYVYSKINLAGTILERSEPFSFGSVIKKKFLQFPRLEDAESYSVSLSELSEDLSLHVSAFTDSRSFTTDLQIEILSVGPMFGRFWSTQNESKELFHAKTESTEEQLLLNVSAQILLSGKKFGNYSVLFVEGIYDPRVGTMYLVGCRDVRASWTVLFESMDLESGLDCLIEVVVSYPPTTSRWLVDPTARISIASQRTEDDPLYFEPVKLQTLPIIYRRLREDILSRQGVEGILRILTLSLGIAFIASQLIYAERNPGSVPFMSLVMLGVQAVGFSLPLITGAEAVFKKSESDAAVSSWFRAIDYTLKLQVMVCLLLTLRLGQKVYKSRQSRDPSRSVPSDKQVAIATFILHIAGYGSVLIVHALRTHASAPRAAVYFDQTSGERVWETKLEEYIGLIHDFFLLPQVVGNFLWQIDTDSKPLRKLYFMGVTFVRLLPHLYDFLRSPTTNPYISVEYEFVNPDFDFFSKVSDVSIPMTAVLLAMVVFVQQRWGYDKIRDVLKIGEFKILPERTGRTYERLPTKVSEAELVGRRKAEHDDEE